MPEPTRQYIFSEGQIKTAFGAVTGLMVLVLVVLLLLITARPQGSFGRADTRQFERTVASASEDLSGFRELEDGAVQIDIERAMELIVERGVRDPFAASAQAGAEPEGAAEEAAAGAEGAAADASAGLPDGAQVYTSCASCHQANGQGIPGAFPPLAGHAADLYQADPEYLAQVVLFGLQGEITVQGSRYAGTMPDWKSLSDGEIAAVLNFLLSSWANDEVVEEEQPYGSEFIAEQRELELTPQDVHERRQQLELP